MSDIQIILEMLEALRWEIRAATYATRGTHRWDNKDTQPMVLRALDQANLHAEKARLIVADAEEG